jgi:hypothetical protein
VFSRGAQVRARVGVSRLSVSRIRVPQVVRLDLAMSCCCPPVRAGLGPGPLRPSFVARHAMLPGHHSGGPKTSRSASGFSCRGGSPAGAPIKGRILAGSSHRPHGPGPAFTQGIFGSGSAS